MKYFFTRKVAMTRQSHAFVAFPGGLGTLDEAFEVLTLLHTGKTDPAPVVLVDRPGGTIWTRWLDFINDEVIGGDYIGASFSVINNSPALGYSPHRTWNPRASFGAVYRF